MNTKERLMMITEIAARHPNVGKTAIMKIAYLMQTLRNVPFDYHFEIYTYGPYCQTVMSDIEYAEAINYLKIETVDYGGGMSGYQINATEEGRTALQGDPNHNNYSQQITDILDFFGDMKARDLELYSTIVFVASSCQKNGWDTSTEYICGRVQSIKPHFSADTIHSAYSKLVDQDFLSFSE